MYPKFLQPTDKEIFIINDKAVEVPKCIIKFDKWNGEPVKETFGGKPIVSVNEKPMFAELGIMTHFILEGWQARWVETYGKNKNNPICLSGWKDDKYKNQVHNPIGEHKIKNLLINIAKQNPNSYAGCWDI